jgi:hypothetical protein
VGRRERAQQPEHEQQSEHRREPECAQQPDHGQQRNRDSGGNAAERRTRAGAARQAGPGSGTSQAHRGVAQRRARPGTGRQASIDRGAAASPGEKKHRREPDPVSPGFRWKGPLRTGRASAGGRGGQESFRDGRGARATFPHAAMVAWQGSRDRPWRPGEASARSRGGRARCPGAAGREHERDASTSRTSTSRARTSRTRTSRARTSQARARARRGVGTRGGRHKRARSRAGARTGTARDRTMPERRGRAGGWRPKPDRKRPPTWSAAKHQPIGGAGASRTTPDAGQGMGVGYGQ